jgi:hypothetical protein
MTLPRAMTTKRYLRLVLDDDPPQYRIEHLQRGGWKLDRTERPRAGVVVCHFTRGRAEPVREPKPLITSLVLTKRQRSLGAD